MSSNNRESCPALPLGRKSECQERTLVPAQRKPISPARDEWYISKPSDVVFAAFLKVTVPAVMFLELLSRQ